MVTCKHECINTNKAAKRTAVNYTGLNKEQ